MDMLNWLNMNIDYENILLKRIHNDFGTFHQKYKTKLKQINDLKSLKTNH